MFYLDSYGKILYPFSVLVMSIIVCFFFGFMPAVPLSWIGWSFTITMIELIRIHRDRKNEGRHKEYKINRYKIKTLWYCVAFIVTVVSYFSPDSFLEIILASVVIIEMIDNYISMKSVQEK